MTELLQYNTEIVLKISEKEAMMLNLPTYTVPEIVICQATGRIISSKGGMYPRPPSTPPPPDISRMIHPIRAPVHILVKAFRVDNSAPVDPPPFIKMFDPSRKEKSLESSVPIALFVTEVPKSAQMCLNPYPFIRITESKETKQSKIRFDLVPQIKTFDSNDPVSTVEPVAEPVVKPLAEPITGIRTGTVIMKVPSIYNPNAVSVTIPVAVPEAKPIPIPEPKSVPIPDPIPDPIPEPIPVPVPELKSVPIPEPKSDLEFIPPDHSHLLCMGNCKRHPLWSPVVYRMMNSYVGWGDILCQEEQKMKKQRLIV